MNRDAEYMNINDDLLISYLLNEASAQQRKQVEKWRAEQSANERRFTEFQLIWEQSAELAFNGKRDAKESLLRLKSRLTQSNATPTTKFKNRSSWFSIAAAIIVLVSGTWIYTKILNQEQQISSVDQVRTDTLSDGSVVTLNKKSLIIYPKHFSDAQRLVTLSSGEAFFKIVPDKIKPFIIQSGNVKIRVVGTSFNVKSSNNLLEVIVETGIVQVITNGKMMSLRPGEKGLINIESGMPTKTNNPDQLYKWYRSKKFIADNTPLWRMVEVLNEAYNTHISIGRKELKNLPLNTTFSAQSLDEILDVISRTFKITVEKKSDQIILK
ncbi:FecR family protein [Pedobacter duraquae]|uniref:FecR family protein n=1 Tax=Pedobacter duraquae TaxID=425511 RepID=A0A4V3C2X2_9SPHI|nr:FecR domain-containing protein [Pedobacter duraquae]TDO19599.1 FecR family protein [Pedobacter duraquae]